MKRVILSKCFGIDYFSETIDKAQIFFKNDHQCSICHCEFTDKAKLKILKCGHSFHEHCIYQWEQTQSMHVSYKCPLCRGEYLKCDKVDYEFREQEGTIDFDVSVKVFNDAIFEESGHNSSGVNSLHLTIFCMVVRAICWPGPPNKKNLFASTTSNSYFGVFFALCPFSYFQFCNADS